MLCLEFSWYEKNQLECIVSWGKRTQEAKEKIVTGCLIHIPGIINNMGINEG